MTDSTLTEEQLDVVMRGLAVPVQPQIMVDLQMEQAMPDPDINEIARLISRDVGLSGQVLKAVNSPFFAPRSRITSVQKAVSLLGIKSVINIVNAIAMRDELILSQEQTDDELQVMNRVWDSAQDVALVSATIAKQLGFMSIDEVYTLGLLHNAGVPLLMNKFDNYPAIMHESYNGQHKRVIDLENERINSNHAVVGFYVARSWRLPQAICDAISQHHNIIDLFSQNQHKGSEVMNLVSVLKMAEHIVGLHRILGQNEIDHEWNESHDIIFQYLGIGEEDYEEIVIICQELGFGLKPAVSQATGT